MKIKAIANLQANKAVAEVLIVNGDLHPLNEGNTK